MSFPRFGRSVALTIALGLSTRLPVHATESSTIDKRQSSSIASPQAMTKPAIQRACDAAQSESADFNLDLSNPDPREGSEKATTTMTTPRAKVSSPTTGQHRSRNWNLCCRRAASVVVVPMAAAPAPVRPQPVARPVYAQPTYAQPTYAPPAQMPQPYRYPAPAVPAYAAPAPYSPPPVQPVAAPTPIPVQVVTAAALPSPPTAPPVAPAPAAPVGDVVLSNLEQGPINYSVNGTRYEMKPGFNQKLTNRSSWTIEFDRGDGASVARYNVGQGSYQFSLTEKGWELFKQDDTPAAPAPIPSFDNIARNR